MKFVSVVQHTSADYLGLIEDHLEGRNIRFRYFRPFTEGTPLPEPYDVGDALFVLGGGPWGTAGARDLPTLKREVGLIHACLMLDKPVVGIELGAQLLAIAAGGSSQPAPLRLTVGEAQRCADDALGGYLPERLPAIAFARDAPAPPDYARILARNDDGSPALFQVGETAFGFSFHPGFKPAIGEDLLMEFEENPPAATEALLQLRSLTHAIEDALVPLMTGLVRCTKLMDY